jgi:hypothetical protein
VTSVLRPDICLLRRIDEVAVIGRALLEKAAGAGHRTIAAWLGRPKEAVRGWLRRFSSRVTLLREHFRHWAFTLDPRLENITPQDSLIADTLEVIGLATRAVSLLFGPRSVWSKLSAMTGGALLSNANSPFPAPRWTASLVSGHYSVPRNQENDEAVHKEEQTRKRAEDVALFRYALVREASDATLVAFLENLWRIIMPNYCGRAPPWSALSRKPRHNPNLGITHDVERQSGALELGL